MYGIEWCNEVLRAFEHKYEHDCREVEGLAGIPRNRVLQFLQRDQLRWRAYKRAVKLHAKLGRFDRRLEKMTFDLGKTG